MKKKLKLKKEVIDLLLKIILTSLIALADILLYAILKMIGIHAGQGSIVDALLTTGWFWLSLGATFSMYSIWSN